MAANNPDLLLLHLLVNHLPDGVLLMEQNGKVLYANPAAESLFGVRESLTGRTLGSPLVEGVTEIELVNDTGEMITAEMRAVQIDWGSKPCFLASLRDITDRKKAYEKVMTLGRSLLDGYEAINRRTGKELHDSIGQPLIGLKLAMARFSNDPDGGARLQEVNTLINGMINSVRDLSHNLRPALKEDFNLKEILENHFHRIKTRYGLSVDFTSRLAAVELTPLAETVVLRVIQEAIDNTLHHAEVDSVTVSVESHDHTIEVMVRDLGRGFDPSEPVHHGLGLKAIRERVELAGGKTEIDSAPGQGTTIRATLPLD